MRVPLGCARPGLDLRPYGGLSYGHRVAHIAQAMLRFDSKSWKRMWRRASRICGIVQFYTGNLQLPQAEAINGIVFLSVVRIAARGWPLSPEIPVLQVPGPGDLILKWNVFIRVWNRFSD